MDVLKKFYLYINDEFCEKKNEKYCLFWKLLSKCWFSLELTKLLRLLEMWELRYSLEWIGYKSVYIYIYIFILWNCAKKRIENFDHSGILCGTIEYGSNCIALLSIHWHFNSLDYVKFWKFALTKECWELDFHDMVLE